MALSPGCLWQSPRHLTHIFSARCRLLFQRRIGLFVSVCALSGRKIGRESCWWYNFLPPGEAKPLQSSGHIFNRLPAKGRALLLHCSQQKANLFWKSLSISKIGLRRLKEVMVLGRNLSMCAFHRIWQVYLPVTWHLRKNVFVIVVFSIVLNQFPLVAPLLELFWVLRATFTGPHMVVGFHDILETTHLLHELAGKISIISERRDFRM